MGASELHLAKLLLETKDIDLIKNLATLTFPSLQVGDSREPGGEAEEQPGAAAEVGEDEELPGRGQVMANNDDDRQGQRQTWVIRLSRVEELRPRLAELSRVQVRWSSC